MRRLAPLILLLLTAAPASAAPITGYAFGHVTRDLGTGLGVPRSFAFGEAVTLRYTYDLDPPDPVFGNRPSVAFEVQTGSGLSVSAPFGTASAVRVDGDFLRVFSALDPRSFDLRLTAGIGTLAFDVDLPLGSWGFVAAVERTETFLPPTMHAPEPSGLLMMLMGSGVLGLAYNNRRRQASPYP